MGEKQGHELSMTEREGTLTDHLGLLIDLFASRSNDRGTLDELQRMIADRANWKKAHALLGRIREENSKALKRGDAFAECQSLFEEACAKTIYNLTREPAPFDPDSPYWIVPRALQFARVLGIEEREIIKIVTG